MGNDTFTCVQFFYIHENLPSKICNDWGMYMLNVHIFWVFFSCLNLIYTYIEQWRKFCYDAGLFHVPRVQFSGTSFKTSLISQHYIRKTWYFYVFTHVRLGVF